MNVVVTVDEVSLADQTLMERNGRRLQGLINQLLELARFESGNMSLAAQRVDPARLTSRIVRTFSSLAERKRISLKMSAAWHGSPAHHPELFVDPERYEQIVNNLISNALKFTPEGGHVNVDLSVTPTEFVLEVRDSGTGIPETQLDSIFGRFNQVQPREVDAGGSSGIGLALAREWVNLHKGSITARNAKVGGSVFTVRLPLGRSHLSDEEIVDVASHVDGVVPPQSNEAAAATPTEAGAGAGTEEFDAFAPDDELRPVPLGAPLVLLVEDNADVRKYVRGHLETRYEVVECENGLEAIEMVRERKPDLIISDVMMGGMDGYELCRAIRTDPDVSDIPIVLLTARAGDEDKVEGLRTGADDYILKPFNSTELMVRAENLIEIRSRLREQYSTHVIQVLPSDVQVESADEAFLRHARELLEEHIDNPNFGTEWLAEEIGLSPRQLRRRIKELTNLSTTGFIRTLRLQRSAQLLEQQAGSVAEIAYAVGFNDPKYFSRLFRQIYGVSPSEYRPRAHES